VNEQREEAGLCPPALTVGASCPQAVCCGLVCPCLLAAGYGPVYLLQREYGDLPLQQLRNVYLIPEIFQTHIWFGKCNKHLKFVLQGGEF
jgi:hypothetical protein